MCGRTGQAMSPAVLGERWDVRVPDDYEPRYNVAPGEDLVTVHCERGTLDRQEWGLCPGWVKDIAEWHFPINARAETVSENATFREAIARRPCLVPSSGYYEWSGERGAKQPYRICRDDRAPFALAGIWERWAGAGGERETVAIVTCEANAVVEPIHDRMPVVLSAAAEDRWLRGDLEDRLDLLDPPAGADFETYPISSAINDPTATGPDLIEPLGHDQGELGFFGA